MSTGAWPLIRTVRRLFREFRPCLPLHVGAVLAALVGRAAQLGFPWLQQTLVDKVMIQGDADRLALTLVSMLALVFAMVLGEGLYQYLSTVVRERLTVSLREHLWGHLYALPAAQAEQGRIGARLALATNDTEAAARIPEALFGMVLVHLVEIGAVLVSLAWIDPRFPLLAFPLLAIYAVVPIGLTPRLQRSGMQIQTKYADLTALLQESLAGLREIKAFLRGAWDLARQRRASEDLAASRLAYKRLELGLFTNYLVFWLVMVGVCWYGGRAILTGQLSIGTLFVLFAYFGYLEQPVSALVFHYSHQQINLAAAQRIFEVYDQAGEAWAAEVEPAVEGSITAGQPPACRLQVEALHFQHPDRAAGLHNINLDVPPGGVVAIVGPSGAGKTTLLNLILRTLEPDQGCVRLDNVDIRQMTPVELRSKIAVAFQDPVIFAMSIADNIRFGKPGATDEDICAAAHLAGAADFIQALPDGYATLAGERGATLSAGQRQRIALARALVRQPACLVLDEATSALDAETESLVVTRLLQISPRPTIVMVTHRFYTLQSFGDIVLLDSGRVVEQGSHQALMQSRGLYCQLFEQQQGWRWEAKELALALPG